MFKQNKTGRNTRLLTAVCVSEHALTSSKDPDNVRAHTGVQASRERAFTPSTWTIFYSPLKFVISRSD